MEIHKTKTKKKKTLNAAKLARLYGIKIIAIGIGNNIDWDEIYGIDGDANECENL